MKKLITLILIGSSLISNGQNFQIAVGTSTSKLDWQFKYDYGGTEDFYLAPITGLAVDANYEYLEKKWFSLTSNLGYFQSGGQISADETHENWILSEYPNNAHNITLGTQFNFIPFNQKTQVMIGFGPRVDYMLPTKNSQMRGLDSLQQIQIGLSGNIGVYYTFEKFKIGLRSTYLYRLTRLIDREPTQPGNWWEPQYLGINARDGFILTNQFVIGFKF